MDPTTTDVRDSSGLSKYEIRERLAAGPATLVYRGVTRGGRKPVLLSTVRTDPSSRELADFEHEHAMLKRLAGAPILHVLGHEVVEGRPWLVLEDPGGQPLAVVAARHRAPDRAIRLAIGIAQAVAEVHRRGVVHQRLDPHSVIVLDDGSVRLTGFRHATMRLTDSPSRMLDGGLAYVAPEQTGRLNRPVDERADLYAFGVVLYELVTGRLPFNAPDAAGWIHAHLARVPAAPHAIDQRIPPSLSAIVLKLLAKDPIDRYQHARGLARDLESCARAFSAGDIAPFPLGTDDVMDEFRVSDRLLGREREVAQLLAGLERARAEASSVISLVPGYSGIGKTSLVSALYQPLARERGRFLHGKFDQFQRDIPYATIAQAFRGLMLDVLAASEELLADSRRRLRDALGANAGVLADVIPEIATLLGPLPPIAELGPREAQNRFEAVFLSFVRVFADSGHPLVVFLDDMQWADDATLRLLQSLGTPSAVSSLHVVLAYRDNEVGAGHPFDLAVEGLRARGAIVETIPVRELEPRHILALVADSVKRATDDPAVAPLADALSRKAGGNPFFVRELLQQLRRDGLLTFDADRSCWEWDERATDAINVAGSVADLLVVRLSSLPAPTRHTLAVAACFGNRVEIDSLALALEVSFEAVSSALSPARQQGFVVAVGDPSGTETFRFHHDRIQQAAYSLLSEEERTFAHRQIGRVLRARFEDGAEDLLFDVVEHLNRAVTLPVDRGERRQVAQLNLAAGRRAKASAAWLRARVYFETAVSLGAEEAWAEDRDAAFSAVRELAECEFLTGRFDRASARFEDLRRRAASRSERAGVVTLHVRLLIVTGRYDDALALAARELEAIGESFPAGEAAIIAAIEAGHRRLARFDLRAMEAVPVLGDSESRALINLLASLPPAVYSRRPALLPLLAIKIVELSIEHGNCEASCFGYSLYAMVLAATLGEPQRALELSEASLALNARLEDPRLRGPALHIHANHILFWSQGFGAAAPFVQTAYEAAMHVGDFTIGAYASFMGAWQEIERGRAIVDTQRALVTHDDRAAASRHATARDVVRLQMQFGRALAGKTLAPGSLNCPDFDADAARDRIATAGLDTGLVMHDLLHATLSWLHERFADAEASLARGSGALAAAFCLPLETTWALVDALTAAALWESSTPAARVEIAKRVALAEGRLRRWASDCPENFEAKHALVVAETARLEGRTLDALRDYERAFVAARRSGMLHLQAIAAQLASRTALANGLTLVARAWLREQHTVLTAWGATALIAPLETAHPDLRTAPPVGVAQLDSLAAIKASQALSRAVNVDDLARTVLRVALENAGAQRAVLCLMRDGTLEVAASASTDPVASQTPKSLAEAVPASVVSYVQRTRSPLLLADMSEDATFSSDPYVARSRPRSVLCMPILVGAELVAVLYLENALITHAFSPDRIALLEVVSTQLAISLENARLHEEQRRSAALHAEVTALASARRDAEAANRAKDEFLAMLGHELRNPLAPILTALQLMGLRPDVGAERERAVIGRQVRHLAGLIDDLLDVSRITQGKIDLRMAPVDIADVVARAVEVAQPLVDEHRHTLRVDVPRLQFVDGDAHRLVQVVSNLLTNAAKFTPSGGTISVSTRSDAGFVEVRVLDNGVGIDGPMLRRVFEPFAQGRQSLDRAQGGLGLGLAIADNLIKLHGGTIVAKSDGRGKGSELIVRLPSIPAPAAPAPLHEARRAAHPGEARVLVVDDNVDAAEMLVEALAASGYQAVVAHDGPSALKVAEEFRPQIALLDLGLPIMSGFELARLLQASPGLSTMKLIALTGYGQAGDRDQTTAAGFGAHMVKPVDLAELRRIIERLL